MAHDSLYVANYVLSKAREEKNDITPMQLLKLVYLCHGWMLGLYGRQLVKEGVEAWMYGPVIRGLYKKVRNFKDKPVTGSLIDDKDYKFDESEKNVMNQVYSIYSKYSGTSLSRLTHERDSPWDKTWNRHGHGSVISNAMIQDYYQHLNK